jgi:hypothetical protein
MSKRYQYQHSTLAAQSQARGYCKESKKGSRAPGSRDLSRNRSEHREWQEAIREQGKVLSNSAIVRAIVNAQDIEEGQPGLFCRVGREVSR